MLKLAAVNVIGNQYFPCTSFSGSASPGWLTSNLYLLCVCVCLCVQLVVRRAAVGDLHPGGVALPGHPRGGALQAAEGGTSHGQTCKLHP